MPVKIRIPLCFCMDYRSRLEKEVTGGGRVCGMCIQSCPVGQASAQGNRITKTGIGDCRKHLYSLCLPPLVGYQIQLLGNRVSRYSPYFSNCISVITRSLVFEYFHIELLNSAYLTGDSDRFLLHRGLRIAYFDALPHIFF